MNHVLFINLFAILNFIFNTAEKRQLDASQSLLLKTLGFTEKNIANAPGNVSLSDFVEFLYSHTEDRNTWRKPNHSTSSNTPIFSAINTIIRKESKRNMKLSFLMQADDLLEYEKCLLVLQLKRPMKKLIFAEFKTMICDDDTGYFFNISKVDILSSSNTSWISMDISYMLEKLLSLEKKNMTLNISIEFTKKSRVKTQAFVTGGHNKPILLLINDKIEFDSMIEYVQTKKKKHRTRRDAPPVENYPSNYTSHCSLHKWNVGIAELGWSFIIRPIILKINVCKGLCPEPIPKDIISTDNALVRSKVRIDRRSAQFLPPPSCLPTSLNSVAILYRLRSEIKMKVFEEMQATECGCF